MTTPRINDDLILSQKAFDYSKKVTADPGNLNATYDFLVWLSKKATEKYPASVFISFHKEHVRILIEIVAGFLQFKKINNYIVEANENLQKYMDAQKELDLIVEEIPESPFGEGGDLILVLLASILKENPDFVKIFNSCLEYYEKTVQAILDSYQAYFDAGRDIERELPKTIEELKKELHAREQPGLGDPIFIEQNLKELNTLHLLVEKEIQQTRSHAGDQIRYLKKLLEQVKKMNRL